MYFGSFFQNAGSQHCFRFFPESSLTLLLTVLNSIWESGIFPPSWREAIIVTISKPGKDSSDSNNYRPIALTSCLCKTMERMVNNRLMWVLESKGLLAWEQCGCRKNRSTADHLVRFDSYIRNAFAKKEHVLAIFFDLEKNLYNLDFRGHCLTSLMGFCPIDCSR